MMLEDIEQDRAARGGVGAVAGLNVFPVKGMRGSSVAEASIVASGLPGDRMAMVVDPSGRFITQREMAALATVEARWDGETLVVSRGAESLKIGFRADLPRKTSTVWRSTIDTLTTTAETNAALSAMLGREVEMVTLDPADPRPVSPDFTPAQEFTGFADGYPVLVANAASMDDLNLRMMERGGEALPMARFRPNIVVRGPHAWAEDTWRRIRVGGAVLRLVKPCDRCIVTTTDQETGERLGDEPLATLVKFRRSKDRRVSGVLFGWNCIIEEPGSAAVGDPVTVLETGEPWPVG